MKVGLVTPGFSASEADWCIPALLDLVRCLSTRAEVHVFPLRYPYQTRPYDVYAARVHPLGGGTLRGPRRAALLGRAVGAIGREHRRAPFDLLHAFWADESGLVAVVCARGLGIPAIVSLAGGELVGFPDIDYGGQLHWSSRLMTGLALRGAARVTVGSTYLRRLAAPRLPAERLAHLPLGVDPDLFHPNGDRDDPPFDPTRVNVLHVASLVPVKAQADLLDAFARAARVEPRLALHVVGDGPLRPILVTRARVLGIAEDVTFHGAMAHERLPAYYRAADLAALTSRHEAQGLVVLEAAACGCTTVGTAVGILPDLGTAARAVLPGDIVGLAREIAALATDSDLRRELGAASVRTVRRDYTLERTVDALERLYRDVPTGRGCGERDNEPASPAR